MQTKGVRYVVVASASAERSGTHPEVRDRNLLVVPPRKKPLDKQKSQRVELRMHPVIKRTLELAAERARCTLTDFIVTAALQLASEAGVTEEDAAEQLASEGRVFESWVR